MKKVIKAGAILIATVLMICVGVWAFFTDGINMGGRVYFVLDTGCSVTVQGAIALSGSIPTLPEGPIAVNEPSEYYQVTDFSTSDMPAWKASDLVFDSGSPVISMQLKFMNHGGDIVEIKIDLPDSINNTTLTGGNNTTGFGNTVPKDTHTAVIDAEEGTTFTYKLSLMDYSKSIPKLEGNFSFTVTLNA